MPEAVDPRIVRYVTELRAGETKNVSGIGDPVPDRAGHPDLLPGITSPERVHSVNSIPTRPMHSDVWDPDRQYLGDGATTMGNWRVMETVPSTRSVAVRKVSDKDSTEGSDGDSNDEAAGGEGGSD